MVEFGYSDEFRLNQNIHFSKEIIKSQQIH